MFSPTPAVVLEMKVQVRFVHSRQQNTHMFQNNYTKTVSSRIEFYLIRPCGLGEVKECKIISE